MCDLPQFDPANPTPYMDYKHCANGGEQAPPPVYAQNRSEDNHTPAKKPRVKGK